MTQKDGVVKDLRMTCMTKIVSLLQARRKGGGKSGMNERTASAGAVRNSK